MKNLLTAKQWIRLSLIAAVVVGIGTTIFHFKTRPSFSIHEILWVTKNDLVYPPGSRISRDFIAQVDEYFDFESMEFHAPMLLFADNLDATLSNRPLLYSPFRPAKGRNIVD